VHVTIARTTKLRCQVERENLGLSVSELARRIGKQPSRLSAYELGRAVPSADSVELVDLALGLHFRGEPAALLEPAEPPT
jgi:transcriptional regulator with XRE-family HTH domain